jgi:hypothetical protein
MALRHYIAVRLPKVKVLHQHGKVYLVSLEYTAVMNRNVGREITIDWEDGGSDTLSAAQAYDLIFEVINPGCSVLTVLSLPTTKKVSFPVY